MEIVKSKISEVMKMDWFEVKEGQELIMTDPCYEIENGRCNHTRKAKSGIWKYRFNKEEGTIDVFQSESAHLVRKDGMKERVFDEIVDCPVDSGQLGVFLKDSYQDDKNIKDIEPEQKTFDSLSNEPWYRLCCEVTCSEDGVGFVPTGFVMGTKYSDGVYPVGIKYAEGTKEVAYIRIITDDICEYCDEVGCDCEICEECGYDVRECVCEYCDECGCHVDYCECEEDCDEDDNY